MKILVCAPTAKELAALAPELFGRREPLEELQPVKAPLKHGEAVFLVTGVGPINAALAVGYALGLLFDQKKSCQGIDAILCAGIAGAFDLDRTPLCSLWQVREEIWPEYGLNDGSSITARAFRFPLWKKEDGGDVYDKIDLADAAAIAGPGFKGVTWLECSSLTVAGVSASFARREALWNAWHAALENMEGFAVAYAAARAGIPCVEIRSVSNKVGPRSRNEKNFDGALAAMARILPSLNLI